jgi:hypothetical protein
MHLRRHDNDVCNHHPASPATQNQVPVISLVMHDQPFVQVTHLPKLELVFAVTVRVRTPVLRLVVELLAGEDVHYRCRLRAFRCAFRFCLR